MRTFAREGSNEIKIDICIRRKVETDEWVIVWKENGKRIESKCYYTNDKNDVKSTMEDMVRRLRNSY